MYILSAIEVVNQSWHSEIVIIWLISMTYVSRKVSPLIVMRFIFAEFISWLFILTNDGNGVQIGVTTSNLWLRSVGGDKTLSLVCIVYDLCLEM